MLVIIDEFTGCDCGWLCLCEQSKRCCPDHEWGNLTDELHVVIDMLISSILCEWSRNLLRGPKINQSRFGWRRVAAVSSSLDLQEVGGRVCLGAGGFEVLSRV